MSDWIDAVTCGVVVHDASGVIEVVNEAACEMLGLSPEQVRGRTSLDPAWRVVREDGSPFPGEEHPAAVVQRTGEAVTDVLMGVYNTAAAEPRWLCVNARPVHDPQSGALRQVVATLSDITAQRATEDENLRLLAQVAAQRERLNGIISHVPGVVWEATGHPDDPTQQINFVSDYVEPMLGYSVDEWLATPNFWLTIVHPEDQEKAAATAAATYRSGEAGSNQFRWVAKDGRVLWVLARSVTVADAQGHPIGMRGVTMDISERRAAEEERGLLLTREQAARAAAEASEQRYRLLADAIPNQLWTARPDGALNHVSQRVLDYFGRSEAEMLEWGWQGVIHADDLPTCIERWGHALQTGEVYEIEFRLRRWDGVYRWYLGRALPQRDETGQIVLWVGTNTDIHEQKRLQEVQRFLAQASSLLTSSLDYKTTLVSVAELAVPHLGDWCGVDIVETDGSVQQLAVTHVDPSKIELARELNRRYPPERNPDAPRGLFKVLRTGEPEIIHEIPPDLLEQAARDAEHLELIRSLGLRSSIVVPLSARGRVLGALSLVSAESGRLYDEDDLAVAQELATRAAIAVDNARLYRAAHQFRQTLDASTDCVLMFPPTDLRYFYANEGASRLLGYSAEELMTLTAYATKPRFDEASFRAFIAPLLDGREQTLRFETIHRCRDGTTVPVEVSLQYVEPEAESGRLISISRDIRERKQAEQALRDRAAQLMRLTRELERSNRELDQFAYVTSHDLKAPLRGIANLSHWLAEDLAEVLTEDTRHQMALLQGRVQRMNALIDGILEYSRVGRLNQEMERVEVGALLAEIVDMLDPTPPFIITIAPDMPTLLTEQMPLQQVFMNLLGNALKHHDRPDGQIRVGVELREGFYEFSVTDDGPGISPRYHEKIFLIFQTLHARDQVEGTGVGLALVKKIVEQHGGTITVESEEGHGATFRFTWPATAGDRG